VYEFDGDDIGEAEDTDIILSVFKEELKTYQLRYENVAGRSSESGTFSTSSESILFDFEMVGQKGNSGGANRGQGRKSNDQKEKEAVIKNKGGPLDHFLMKIAAQSQRSKRSLSTCSKHFHWRFITCSIHSH
jgi:hypothetical protein